MNLRDVPFTGIHRFQPIWLSVILVLIFQTISPADERLQKREFPSLRGEFPIGKEGRLILLPVKIADEEFSFLLDTGACYSGVDASLRNRLGEPRGSQRLQTPAGITRADTFDWPDVTMDGRALKTNCRVACVDLAEIRRATNEQIFGVIGMDILKDCRLQLDFDRGFVRFLESLPEKPEDLGVRIPIELSATNAPFLVGVLADDSSEHFLIDLGAEGNSFRSEIFDRLLDRNLIRLGGPFSSVTVGGNVQGSRGRLRSLSVGQFAHEGLRVARLNVSSLGLRYFSRFQVTFDFPDSAVYLRAGGHHLKPEPRATSGMSLSWVGGNVKVDSIKKDGPAAKAGIRSNDLLMRINGNAAADYDHFALRQLLTSERGRKVAVRVRRGDREVNTELTLDED